MAKTEAEKLARKERARKRAIAKAAGTYVPRDERKERKREIREAEAKRMQERIRQKLEAGRGNGKRPRLEKPVMSAGVLRHFADGEIVLIKAVIIGIVHPGDTGQMRYYAQPIGSPTSIDRYEPAWLVKQSCMAKWPRKKKKGGGKNRH